MERALTLFNKFDKTFTQLERRTGGDPSRVKWLVYNEATARRVVGTIYYLDQAFKAALFRTTAMQVPPWFLSRYRDYRTRFGPEVDNVYGLLSLLAIGEDKVDGIPSREIFSPGDPDACDTSSERGSYMQGFGAEDVDFVFRWVTDMMDGSDREEELERGIDAWDHFANVIGVDLDGIESRWNSLPRTLIPSGSTGSGKAPSTADIETLLNQAARAYVFGLPEAAMAMCRAVCELVLKRYYADDDDGETGEKSLSNLIILAERKFARLRKFRLKTHVQNANRVLHEFRADQLPSKQRDEMVRSFLETVKSLIENARKSVA